MSTFADLSLMEQMGLTTRDVARRLHMLNFTDEDATALRLASDHFQQYGKALVDEFYVEQLSDPEISIIIGDSDTLKRLRSAMLSYVHSLFRGTYDEDYVNQRLRIGKVHKRMGVTPKFYVSSLNCLQHLVEKSVFPALESEHRTATLEAIRKIFLFDTQLVFESYMDGYLSDMEVAKKEIDRYAHSLEIKVETLSRQLHETSIKDSLTGLYNHRAFYEYLDREIKVAMRHGLPLCLLYMDLNNFKTLNDTEGHNAGDKVLENVGSILTTVMREVDICCRFGGDEFCVIMPRTTMEQAATPLKRLMEAFAPADHSNVSFSMGLAQTGANGKLIDADTLVHTADQAMYKAKAEAKSLNREQPPHTIQNQIVDTLPVE